MYQLAYTLLQCWRIAVRCLDTGCSN